jgi:hypothetical protein
MAYCVSSGRLVDTVWAVSAFTFNTNTSAITCATQCAPSSLTKATLEAASMTKDVFSPFTYNYTIITNRPRTLLTLGKFMIQL